MAVFEPNLTSHLLLRAAEACCRDGVHRYLELGCGSGFITRSLIDAKLLDGKNCYLSDVSHEAIEAAQLLLEGQIDASHVMQGDCFEPWIGMQFDLIVSDVAGISDAIAAVSEWYRGVPCNAGNDGLFHTLRVADEARALLAPNGTLLFPIISLANTTQLLKAMTALYHSVSVTQPTWWPLPRELENHTGLLYRLREHGFISFEKKYGRLLATTSIAHCTHPIIDQD